MFMCVRIAQNKKVLWLMWFFFGESRKWFVVTHPTHVQTLNGFISVSLLQSSLDFFQPAFLWMSTLLVFFFQHS